MSQRKFSLSFWQTMTVMNRPLNSLIHGDDGKAENLKGSDDIKVVSYYFSAVVY